MRKVDNTIHWVLIFTRWITQLVFVILIHWILIYLAQVVQKLDSTIHQINHYSVDKYYGKQLRYPLDSDLSAG